MAIEVQWCNAQCMIDDFAKEYLADERRWARSSLVAKLDGLTEYDARRPLSRTGTNLLGLVKHLTLSKAVYFGVIFGRPFSDSIATFDDPGFQNRDYMWAAPEQSRADIVAGYLRACQHADTTIEALPIDAQGYVPWWPRPEVLLFNVMVHVLAETDRHLGHADILREQIDERSVPIPYITVMYDELSTQPASRRAACRIMHVRNCS